MTLVGVIHIQKLSDVQTIKNRWLMTKTSVVLRRPEDLKNHRKISDEYDIKKALIEYQAETVCIIDDNR